MSPHAIQSSNCQLHSKQGDNSFVSLRTNRFCRGMEYIGDYCYGGCWAERIEEEEKETTRAAGALGMPAAGLCPRPAREKEFLSNLLFD